MAGFGDLIGVLMQNGMSSSGGSRFGKALGEQGLGQAGGIFDQILKGAGSRGGNAGGGGDMLGGLLEAAGKMFGGRGAAGGGGLGDLGSLAGSVFGGGSAPTGSTGKGAMAVLAGLALQALLKGRGGNIQSAVSADALPLGLRAPANEQEARELEQGEELVLRAMLNAAKADGTIDPSEVEKLTGKVRQSGAEDDALNYMRAEMGKPPDLDGLIAAVPNAQIAAQVYAASLFAIEVDTPQEVDYLRRLADGLGLETGVVREIHSALGVRAV